MRHGEGAIDARHDKGAFDLHIDRSAEGHRRTLLFRCCDAKSSPELRVAIRSSSGAAQPIERDSLASASRGLQKDSKCKLYTRPAMQISRLPSARVRRSERRPALEVSISGHTASTRKPRARACDESAEPERFDRIDVPTKRSGRSLSLENKDGADSRVSQVRMGVR